MNEFGIYALAIAIIPFITQFLKKLSWMPPKFVPLLPVVMGLLTSIITNVQGGMEWIPAIIAGLGVGAGATQVRQIVVKSLKSNV